MSSLPISVFGLSEPQLASIAVEIDREFTSSVNIPMVQHSGAGTYDYGVFSTRFQLTESELVDALHLLRSISMASSLVETYYQEHIDCIKALASDLITAKRHGLDETTAVCTNIRKESLHIAEESSSVRTLIGLCKINMAVNRYLGQSK